MKNDFGYLGSGLEGYVQYNVAFKRNFDSASALDNIPEDDKPDENKSEDEDDEGDDEDGEF